MDRTGDWVGGGGRGGHGRCVFRGLFGHRVPDAGRCAGVLECARFSIPAAKAIGKASGMREAFMSSGLFVARTAERGRARSHSEDKNLKQVEGWNPEDFAREQIQGLVRQVFFSSAERPVRQVVFSAAEAETDVQNLCWQVGEALSLETSGDIALVGEYPQVSRDPGTR